MAPHVIVITMDGKLNCFLWVYASVVVLASLPGSLRGQSGVLALCPGQPGSPGSVLQEQLYGPQGQLLTLLLDPPSAALADCEVIRSEQTSQRLLWSGLIRQEQRSDNARGFILQGNFSADQGVSVSDITSLAEQARPSSTPPQYGENLLDRSEALTFGREERATYSSSGELSCRPGEFPAGVQFDTGMSWPGNSNAELQLQLQGQGEFTLALANVNRIATEQPLELAGFDAPEELASLNFGLPLSQDEPFWQALTVLCPDYEARLALDNLTVLPAVAGESDLPRTERSAWLWSPRLWLENPEQLWQIVAAEALTELYITIEVDDNGELPFTALAEFMAEAERRQLQVWPVIGDPRDVLETSWPALRNRLLSYGRFNGRQEEGFKLQGVQLDIEPYLLPGFRLDPGHWREQYINTVAFARSVLGPFLNIDLVIPVWWGSHPQYGPGFLDRLAPYRVSLTVMNYRTEPLQLLNGADVFLDWGERHQRPVSIGLEAGSLSDEQLRRYVPDDSGGELWQLPFKSLSLLLLFDGRVSGLQGDAFRFENQRSFPASNLSFEGDLQQMYSVAAYLERHFANRTAFRGFSFHGLDEVYSNRRGN
jgi:hypothetical protein